MWRQMKKNAKLSLLPLLHSAPYLPVAPGPGGAGASLVTARGGDCSSSLVDVVDCSVVLWVIDRFGVSVVDPVDY